MFKIEKLILSRIKRKDFENARISTNNTKIGCRKSEQKTPGFVRKSLRVPPNIDVHHKINLCSMLENTHDFCDNKDETENERRNDILDQTEKRRRLNLSRFENNLKRKLIDQKTDLDELIQLI